MGTNNKQLDERDVEIMLSHAIEKSAKAVLGEAHDQIRVGVNIPIMGAGMVRIEGMNLGKVLEAVKQTKEFLQSHKMYTRP